MMSSLFLKQWTKVLEDQQVFDPNDLVKMVTTDNLYKIIQALDLSDLIPIPAAEDMLDCYEHKQASFFVFYKDLVKMMEQISESDC